MKNLPEPNSAFITTRSGLYLEVLDPKPSQIEIGDIAAGLAYKAHFGGQTPYFFSIAQHSIEVANMCRDDLKLIALLHDASEAYMGDALKPYKIYMPEFVELENRLQKAIFLRFGLDYDLIKEVKDCDIAVQELEYKQFFVNKQRGKEYFKPMRPEKARKEFLKYFHILEKKSSTAMVLSE